MSRFYERCSSYKFLGKLTLLICGLIIVFMFMMSFSLLPYNEATPLVKALNQFAFFPIVYVIVLVLTFFLGVMSFLRWRSTKKNMMYLIHLIYAIVTILLLLNGFDLVRLSFYELVGQTKALKLLMATMSETKMLSHLMSMLFAFLTCGYLSLGMMLISLVLQIQIAGKLYFPRSE